jgi:hypothetical protein
VIDEAAVDRRYCWIRNCTSRHAMSALSAKHHIVQVYTSTTIDVCKTSSVKMLVSRRWQVFMLLAFQTHVVPCKGQRRPESSFRVRCDPDERWATAPIGGILR